MVLVTLTFGGHVSQGAIHAALQKQLLGFDQLAVAVSYVQLSGWELLKPLIADKAANVRILCTDQFGITDPAAIRAIQQAGVSVRAYAGSNVFHPKIFISSRGMHPDRLVVGSANLSRSAMMTGVEAVVSGKDAAGTSLAWFNSLFGDDAISGPFDNKRLTTLENAFAARLKTRLAYGRNTKPDVKADIGEEAPEAIEAAFATLPALVVPLNIDKAGNNVRSLRRVGEILNGLVKLEGKALSEMKLLGFASDGQLNALGRSAKGSDLAAIAERWTKWLSSASPDEIFAANPSGILAQGRRAIEAFWDLPVPVCDYFLQYATSPRPDVRPRLQTIELLANTGRSLPGLTLDDVDCLSCMLDSTSQLPQQAAKAIKDYLSNKGTRGWDEPDRVLILKAWRAA